MHRLDTVALLHSCFLFSALSRALDHIPNAFALAQACHKTDLHLTGSQCSTTVVQFVCWSSFGALVFILADCDDAVWALVPGKLCFGVNCPGLRRRGFAEFFFSLLDG